MTLRAIAGVVALNLVVLFVGATVLWGLRGWRCWAELARLAGVAYMLGVASLGVALTLELALGVQFGAWTFVLTAGVISACAIVAGIVAGGRLPTLRPAGWRFPRMSLLGAILGAAIVVYLEGLFRAGRLAAVWEFDAWWVWTIRAKELYLSGDPGGSGLVREEALSYPPSLSLLQAEAFEAMGGIDTVSLHAQHWFLAAGFVAALVGLLAGRVRTSILLPCVLLVLVIPRVADQLTWIVADPMLGFQLALGALLVGVWLEDRGHWQLASATVLLAGATLTKREGCLFAACVLLAAAVASWRDRRWAWPRLGGSAALVVVAWLPWQVWVALHGDAAAPSAGFSAFFDDPGRAWSALSFVVRSLIEPGWLGVLPLVLIAAVLAFRMGERRLAVYTTALMALSIGVIAVVFWSEPLFELSDDSLSRTPIQRTGLVVLLPLAVLVPLLLERAWVGASRPRSPDDAGYEKFAGLLHPRPLAGWVLFTVAILVTPAAMLASGAPRFPSASECAREPTGEGPVRVVVGYAEAFTDAGRLEARAAAAGLPETSIELDGCGRLRVFVDAPASAAGRIVSAAEASGLEPTVEGPSGRRQVAPPAQVLGWRP